MVVYAIEATCHAPSLEGIYREVYKCLKPGGVFGFYEWNMTDAWDASNPEHKDIAHGIEVSQVSAANLRVLMPRSDVVSLLSDPLPRHVRH